MGSRFPLRRKGFASSCQPTPLGGGGPDRRALLSTEFEGVCERDAPVSRPSLLEPPLESVPPRHPAPRVNERSLRRLDRWIGIPLCWLLTALLHLSRRLGPDQTGAANAPPRKILFVKLSEMGAILLAMPAFEAARARVGIDHLYCLMLEQNRGVHDLVGFFRPENLILIRDRNLALFVLDVLRAMRRCRREGIDCAIDLEGFSRISALLVALSGARIRVGAARYTTEGLYRGELMTHGVSHNYYHHASVQFLTLVEAIGAAPSETPLLKRSIALDAYRLTKFVPSEREREDVDRLLRARSGSPRPTPLVVLNCNLIDQLPLRRWPRENFALLGRRILDANPHATIVLTGLAAERTASEALAREISPRRCFSLAGDTTLRGLVALLGLADLLVTSDCGPAHMAALTDVPILSIFGPETPQLYAPLTPDNHSLWAGLACSPCLHAFNHRSSACRDNVCMRSVSVDAVFSLAQRLCPAIAASPATGA